MQARLRSAAPSHFGISVRGSGVVTSATWLYSRRPATINSTPLHAVHTTHVVNLSKLNDITVTAASSGDVSRLRVKSPNCCACATALAINDPDDFTIITQASKALTPVGYRERCAGGGSECRGAREVTLEQLAMTMERASRTIRGCWPGGRGVAARRRIGIMNITLLSVTERTRASSDCRMAVVPSVRDVMPSSS